MSARCESCHARVLWVRGYAGRMVPLDAEPVVDGRWQILDGAAVPVGTMLAPKARYHTHYATCPFTRNGQR